MPTSISWTNESWNPVTGCNKVSQGCKNCYAENIADRFFAKQYPPNPDGSPRKFTDVRCHPERLTIPLSWTNPKMAFVNSMSDLFHEDVPFDFIDMVFATMAQCSVEWNRCTRRECDHCPCDENKLRPMPIQTFQILTKRAGRMLEYLSAPGRRESVLHAWDKLGWYFDEPPVHASLWPLPNVWLGVSVENQKAADERIPHLLNTPAAVRWISAEPLLESINLRVVGTPENHLDALECQVCGWNGQDPPKTCCRCQRLDWVVCGGESGPGARPFNLTWGESLLAQCQHAHVPFFMKQTGVYPVMDRYEWEDKSNPVLLEKSGKGLWLSAINDRRTDKPENTVAIKFYNRKGEDPDEWPEHLRVREFPQVHERSSGRIS